MQLRGNDQRAETSGVQQTSQFQIKATGKAFKILSDGLYSDKPLAVVRELTCNAWDAHIAAGLTDLAFEVKIPTALDPTFHVKDFGIGLSHDDVMHLYTTYFDSTKSDSNAFTGALGLGSKSPFSYVDQFNVTSRFEGVVRNYTAFLGDQGFPSIALLSENPTDQGNGLEVGMPVKMGDIQNFYEAAGKVLRWFPVAPVIHGASGMDLTLEVNLEGKGWRLLNRKVSDYEWQRRGALVALMGNVVYPVNETPFAGQPDLAQIINYPFVVEFPLGSLDVAASREALSYDQPTIDAIVQRIRQVKQEVGLVLGNRLKTASNQWEASVLFRKVVEDSRLSAVLPKGFTADWQGHSISLYGIKLELKDPINTDLRSAKGQTAITSCD